ncbi:Agmatine deiminase [Thalassovita autumnalis]|uniref:Agmatine deiminase n=1 Tax=Thalassovita autumnalis TaxID=2072972 RepID=A0A0P1FVU4_9RHOB|nr:agmatine deiminase family protein [Thalassovita autumnalis]CUH64048.1 Agmatine deiminase [Thalassovita autumnalis]CUH72804.1 Agmatine deiminase [Thalassovita autumnalis]
MQRRSVLAQMIGGLGAGLTAGLAGVKATTAEAAEQGTEQHAGAWYVPAEEVPHELTFMQFPVALSVYGDRWFLQQAQTTIAEIANTIAEFEPVVMLAAAGDHASARQLLSDKVTLWDIPTEDLWCRDSGPIVAVDGTGGRAVQHIQFNGWGGKQRHRRDGRVAERVAERLGLPLLPTGLVGEAGGVEQDGHGLLCAHESSWVISNRNPGMHRDQVEAALLAAYGADRMIWAPGVKGQDITDYHIDSLMRFTGPGRGLINLPEEPDFDDPFHISAFETHDILQAAGVALEVISEPNVRRVQSLDFVASYANYYVCNGAVIAAEFGDRETDAAAERALRRLYPGRDVVMLNVDPLGELGGGIHCATHELPSG